MRTAKTSGLVRAGAVMAVATIASRATGFLAKVVLLAVIGVSAVNDAYTMANTLPNIVFELLLGGVLTSVAIPLLSRATVRPGRRAGVHQAAGHHRVRRAGRGHRPGDRSPRRC